MPPINAIYSQEYKQKLFVIWYNAGKPYAGEFGLIIPDYNGKVPNRLTLTGWIDEWQPKADEWDHDIETSLRKNVVAAKVKMYEEHSGEAKDLRLIAFDYLKANADSLTPSTAIRLWELAVQVQQLTSGIPEAIRKMHQLDNDELLEEIRNELLDGKIIDESD